MKDHRRGASLLGTDNKTERCLKYSAHPRKRADFVIARDGSTISYTLKRSFRQNNESNFRQRCEGVEGKSETNTFLSR